MKYNCYINLSKISCKILLRYGKTCSKTIMHGRLRRKLLLFSDNCLNIFRKLQQLFFILVKFLIISSNLYQYSMHFCNISGCKLCISISITICNFCLFKSPDTFIWKPISTLQPRKQYNSLRWKAKCLLNFSEMLHITVK